MHVTVDTPLHATFTSGDVRERTVDQTALRRPGLPMDVAGALLYLMSDLASFVTGEIIEVNGGLWFA